VPAAVWRKHRIGELSSEDAAVLVEEFEWDWFEEADAEMRFVVLAVTDDVLEIAARSVARHSLRAFDAVQLASALTARAVDASLASFACFDDTLAGAARAEGFTLVP
jgi:hypothetical protein